jgi:hypothetical protein
VACREEQTPEGPVAYLQSVYYEHLGVPAWLAHIAAGAALWAAIKAWSTGFRKFQAQVEQQGSIEAVLASAKEAREAADMMASSPLSKGSPQVVVAGAAGLSESSSVAGGSVPVRTILASALLFAAGIVVGAKVQHRKERRVTAVAAGTLE